MIQSWGILGLNLAYLEQSTPHLPSNLVRDTFRTEEREKHNPVWHFFKVTLLFLLE